MSTSNMKHGKGITDRFPAQVFVPMIDAGAVLFAGFLAYCIRFCSTDVHDLLLLGMVIIAIFVVMANFIDGAYVRWRTTRLSNILFRLLCIWGIVACWRPRSSTWPRRPFAIRACGWG